VSNLTDDARLRLIVKAFLDCGGVDDPTPVYVVGSQFHHETGRNPDPEALRHACAPLRHPVPSILPAAVLVPAGNPQNPQQIPARP